jgi:hypothetical protein
MHRDGMAQMMLGMDVSAIFPGAECAARPRWLAVGNRIKMQQVAGEINIPYCDCGHGDNGHKGYEFQYGG